MRSSGSLLLAKWLASDASPAGSPALPITACTHLPAAFEGYEPNTYTQMCVHAFSGAGKSTFANTLLGTARSYGELTGTIKVNDELTDMSKYKDVVGFVPQDDIVHGVSCDQRLCPTAYVAASDRPGM